MILNPTFEQLRDWGVSDGIRVSVHGDKLAVADGRYHSHENIRLHFGFTGTAYVLFRSGSEWRARLSHTRETLFGLELPPRLRELLKDLNSLLIHA